MRIIGNILRNVLVSHKAVNIVNFPIYRAPSTTSILFESLIKWCSMAACIFYFSIIQHFTAAKTCFFNIF